MNFTESLISRQSRTRVEREAQSDTMSDSKSSDCLLVSTAIPWAAIGPLIMILSPGCKPAAELMCLFFSSSIPMPDVFIKTPSHAFFSTTFVSPVTIFTPAFSASSAMDDAIFSRESMGKPSSIMNPQLI